MTNNRSNRINKEFIYQYRDHLSSGLVGIEKEGLRVEQSKISHRPHPKSLGSALCNKYITTDFSEAQLELITPPRSDKRKALEILENIHGFVTSNIDKEVIWPLSIPPPFESENEISIANYGSSDLAIFKRIYRNGLASRYGRSMQAISGLHFNYSLPKEIWEHPIFLNQQNNSSEQRSSRYFNMLRNIFKMNWLLLYLFGASPVITKNYIQGNLKPFKKISKETFYMPYATSLRMSEFGYQNLKRSSLNISLNSLDEYAFDLRKATSTINEDFIKINSIQEGSDNQISQNILQIEDEYYAVARAKSEDSNKIRLSSKLLHGGVDFIELRSLDLNPFQPEGIDIETIFFLELFLIYCFFKNCQPISNKNLKHINNNDSLTALFGRDPALRLDMDGKNRLLTEFGKQILEEMEPLAEIIDSRNKEYSSALSRMQSRVNSPEETPSSQILDQMISSKLDLLDFGSTIAKHNRDHYKKINQAKSLDKSYLYTEVKRSIEEQTTLESKSEGLIEDFIKHYFNN